jgi:TrmH family RNA methyltransferase
MNKPLLITSSQNEKIKQLIRLKDKKGRDQEGFFLIEGYREILRAHEANYPISQLFFCEKLFLGTNETTLIQKISRDANIFELTQELFEKCSYRDRPDGLLALAPIKRDSLSNFSSKIKKRANGKEPFILVAESIEKPGNLGSIFRSSDAAGVHGIIVCDRKTDVFNPNVVRASIGTLFSIPFIECGIDEALEYLKNEKIKLVAATPHAKEFFTQVDLTQPVAIAMGTEQLGLSDKMMKASDISVKIPMFGAADSLNVAAATTLMLYECVRQRFT